MKKIRIKTTSKWKQKKHRNSRKENETKSFTNAERVGIWEDLRNEFKISGKRIKYYKFRGKNKHIEIENKYKETGQV